MSSNVPAGSPAKVLLVDDNPANLLALEAVLQDLGAELVRAVSGDQALACTLADDFAAILMDVRMPGLDGFETARLIRSRPRSRTTPILFITASTDSPDEYLEGAYALGAVDFLTKPLHAPVLKGKVSFFIELYRSREELREAERAAVNERAFLATVLDAVQDAIVACDAQGRLTLFNRATRELHGLPAETLPSEPLLPEAWSARYCLLRADRCTPLPPEEAPLMRALAGEPVHNVETCVRAADGSIRTLLANGQPLYDGTGRGTLGAVVSLHDVTSLREATAAREMAVREQARREAAEAAAERLRASEERYRNLFDSMEEGFCVIEVLFDEHGTPNDYLFLEANPTFGRHTGLKDVVGRRMRELVGDIDQSWLDAYGQVARTGQAHRVILRIPRYERYFDVSITPVGGPGSRRVALLGSEVTERVRAEETLRRLAEELAASDQRKTEFLATLAHELRNPLAPLRNGLFVMRQSKDEKARQRTWEMMDRQLGHMVRLIDDLMDIARVSTGKVEIRRARVALQQVVENAVETSHPLLEQSGHSLKLDLPAEPLPMEVDPTRIAQVLSNLLSNAAKYTPARGHIELGARVEGNEVRLWVKDDGIGIQAADLPRIFQMFTQVSRDRQQMTGGLGIGLALVRAIVELHGGRIDAESAGRGAGSTFTVRLPITAPRPREAEEAMPTPGGLNVLVVDDNEDAAESLALILQMDGHVARVAHDGRRALELAQAYEPQVVFLDIGMPGMNGYEVARALREQKPGRQPVLVALTGWGSQEDLARTRAAGFDHHLTKPADIAQVERLLVDLRDGTVGAGDQER